MADGTGTAEIDFGDFPGSNEASVTVTATGITESAHVEAWVMASDTTADHTASDHRYFPLFAALTAAAGTNALTIYARSTEKLQGAWAVHYVWAS